MSDEFNAESAAAAAAKVETVKDLGDLFVKMMNDNSQKHTELTTLINTTAQNTARSSSALVKNLKDDMIAEMNHRSLNMWWNFQQEKDVEKCIYFYDEPKSTTPDGRGRKDHTKQGLDRVYELIGGNTPENITATGFKECWIDYVTRFAQSGRASRKSNYGSTEKFDTIRVIFVDSAYANLIAAVGRRKGIDGFRIGQTITQQKMYKHSKTVCTKLNDDPNYNAKHKVRNYMPVFAGYKDDVEPDDRKYQKPPTSFVYDPLFFLPNDRKAGHNPPVRASIPRHSYQGQAPVVAQPSASSKPMGLEGLARSGPMNAAEYQEFLRWKQFKEMESMQVDDKEYSTYLKFTEFLEFHNSTIKHRLISGDDDPTIHAEEAIANANTTPKNAQKRARPPKSSTTSTNDEASPVQKASKITESPPDKTSISSPKKSASGDDDSSNDITPLDDSQEIIKATQDEAEIEAEKIYQKLMARHAKMDHKAKKWDIVNLDTADKSFATLIQTEIVNKLAEAQQIKDSGKNAPKRMAKIAEEIESDLEILSFLERGCSVLGTGTVKPPIAGALICSSKDLLALTSEQLDLLTHKVNQIFEMKDSPRTYIMKVSEASQKIAQKYARDYRPVPRTTSKMKKKT